MKYYFLIKYADGSCGFCDNYDTIAEAERDMKYYISISTKTVTDSYINEM